MKIRTQHKARQLRIYRTLSGQWGGRLCEGPVPIANIAGCETPAEVRHLVGMDQNDDNPGSVDDADRRRAPDPAGKNGSDS
ncbi:hypothetical protein AAGS40_25045 (plasmid) [Paraburkholderia sp. PREW-6R]|uniref:hypothetical protein n=1 Tax=Paraburkholderia sp. PREW-6R TaxID=3141544 RepID=UPI0031F4AE8F